MRREGMFYSVYITGGYIFTVTLDNSFRKDKPHGEIQFKPFITKSIHSYMNPQPRPDNMTIVAITTMTTSRWVLTSSSHSNTQTNTKYKTKVTEYVGGSYLQRLALEDGGWSSRVFCRRVCAAQWSSSD